MHTEAEAKTKWCPHVRVWNGHDATASNRPFESGYQPQCCIGSACMQWRWVMENRGGPAMLNKGKVVWFLNRDDPEVGNLTDTPPADARGYCGLAGEP